MELLDRELDKLKPYLSTGEGNIDAPGVVYDENLLDAYVSGKLTDYCASGSHEVARLRLDFELNNEAETSWNVGDLLIKQMRGDLEDLLENGDIDNTTDALLKVLNGSKKRGTGPKDINIFSAHLYKNYFAGKNSTEYTVFTLMYVEW